MALLGLCALVVVPAPASAQAQLLPPMNAVSSVRGRAPSRADMTEFVRNELKLNASLSHAAVLEEARRRVDLGHGPRPARASKRRLPRSAGNDNASPGCGQRSPAVNRTKRGPRA